VTRWSPEAHIEYAGHVHLQASRGYPACGARGGRWTDSKWWLSERPVDCPACLAPVVRDPREKQAVRYGGRFRA
jgi:hypothetical protein